MTAIDTKQTLTTPLDDSPAPAAPDWVAALRRRGRDFFDAQGLPTRKDEEWQESNVREIAKHGYAPAKPCAVSADDLARFAIPGLDAHVVVLVDGVVSDDLSSVGDLPAGCVVATLAEAVEAHGDAVRAALAQQTTPEADAFAALNAAYLCDGVFVHVPADAALDKPVLVRCVSTHSEAPTMSHPRVLFTVGDRGRGEVIEQHVGLRDDSVYLSNGVTEVVVGDEANASHTFIELDGAAAFNVTTLAVTQGTRSDFTSHTMLLGGKVVRNQCRPTLAGEAIESTLNGLYLPADGVTMDNHMYVHHTAPGCHSRQFYTGVLQGDGKGVFAGRIKVERPAQQTDAVQASKNLILSADAHAHNRPQLEIFADDVKCTHGCTTGELDEQSIFYLQARGIPREDARGLLVFAFANESLERVEDDAVRVYLADLVRAKLALSDAVQHLLDD